MVVGELAWIRLFNNASLSLGRELRTELSDSGLVAREAFRWPFSEGSGVVRILDADSFPGLLFCLFCEDFLNSSKMSVMDVLDN